MALHGAELLATAKIIKLISSMKRVWQGNSILRSIVEGLSSDLITKVMGIVNGTTNFILTKMSDEGEHITTC